MRIIAFNDEKQTRKMMIISIIVFIIALLAFTISYVIFSGVIERELKIAEIKSSIDELDEKDSLAPASTTIGKTIQQVVLEDEEENMKKETGDEVNKIAINTSNIIKTKEIEENVKEEKETIEEEPEEIIIPDPVFERPVEGEIVAEFAKDELIYSNTLGEWVTHLGIDIKAPKATVVKAAEAGIIKSIKNDPRYGMTVVIEHVNGYSSIYANLSNAEFVKQGEEVDKGETIGTIGNTGAFEIAEEPHLHFEILKDGENINPNIFENN